jgi:hypothetical protein
VFAHPVFLDRLEPRNQGGQHPDVGRRGPRRREASTVRLALASTRRSGSAIPCRWRMAAPRRDWPRSPVHRRRTTRRPTVRERPRSLPSRREERQRKSVSLPRPSAIHFTAVGGGLAKTLNDQRPGACVKATFTLALETSVPPRSSSPPPVKPFGVRNPQEPLCWCIQTPLPQIPQKRYWLTVQLQSGS